MIQEVESIYFYARALYRPHDCADSRHYQIKINGDAENQQV